MRVLRLAISTAWMSLGCWMTSRLSRVQIDAYLVAFGQVGQFMGAFGLNGR
jgi:hypothetical protein